MAAPLLLILLGLAHAAAPAAGCALDPSLPPHLAAYAHHQLLCAGFLNATAAPYSAAGDGSTDDTSALQAALDDAYAYRMAVLLEPGRVYIVTRQLRAVQAGKPKSMREYGYQLIGGRGAAPPVLKVADGASLDGFPSIGTSTLNGQQLTARPAVLFALNMSNTSGHPANNAPMLYSAMLRNIDIDLGNNPALSGVSMSGAQLCSIEDVRVRGEAFMSGLVGLPGSGGYSANVQVTGGQVGVWQQEFRPNPSITGLIALNQSLAGVLLENSRGPLVISGFVIRSSYSRAGVMIAGKGAGGDGGIALEDGLIALNLSTASAIASAGTDISLRNIFVEAATAVTIALSGSSSPLVVVGSNPGTIKKIARWSFSAGGSIAFVGFRNASVAATTTGIPKLDLRAAAAVEPPADSTLVTKHSWSRQWAQKYAWSASPAIMLDAVRDCGATPEWVNSTDDDGGAIAACFESKPPDTVVFVPRGDYLLWNTLVLRSGQSLVGAGKHSATLAMRSSPVFAAAPLMQVVDAEEGAEEGAEVAAKGIAMGSVLTDLVLVAAQRGTLLSVSARGTLLRDVRTGNLPPLRQCYRTPRQPSHMYVLVGAAAGTAPCTNHRSPNQPACPQRPSHPCGRPKQPACPVPPPGVSTPVAGLTFTGSASGRFYGLSLDHFSTCECHMTAPLQELGGHAIPTPTH